MTIQTAINQLHSKAVDRFNHPVQTAFRKFIDHCRSSELFVVMDEAHHAPAYGCRNLLIGEKSSELGLRGLVPHLHLLGLTATPTYTDKSRRGWLGKIFEKGVIYKVDKTVLIAQKVLARPNYIEVQTGRELEVNDQLYDRLVRQHKDLPENIIEALATDNNRNNLIVNYYLDNKEKFGKTIIFADRWFQCVSIKEKLIKKGIRADAIYSHIDADPGSPEARNQRTQDDNKRILSQFKTGKDEYGNDAPLDVLINVRMLTEGADVPTVQTVFITRQTTSSILLTQMIGRALRGERTGGSSEANIVLFFDNWKRLIDWASPEPGDIESSEPIVKGYYPLECVSIRLVEELVKLLEDGECPLPSFSSIVPVGWYKTEVLYAQPDNTQESMEAFTEFVLAYEHNQPKFEKFVNFISNHANTDLLDEWSKEYLDDEWMQPQIEQWIDTWFDRESDDIGETLNSDLIKIVRHIAQNQAIPSYHCFEERENYDLDKLAQQLLNSTPLVKREHLTHEFSQKSLWKTFYKSFSRFETAVDATIRKILDGSTPPPLSNGGDGGDGGEPPGETKRQVKERDNYTCLCCGLKKGEGIQLQIDHIVPASLGGDHSLDNLQTLCSICNRHKKIDEIDFRLKNSLLRTPKQLNITNFKSLLLYDRDIDRTITRIVNFFYHCNAVYKFTWHQRKNAKYYSIWEIQLYLGNNPTWLLQYKAELLRFIHQELKCPYVEDIRVITLI